MLYLRRFKRKFEMNKVILSTFLLSSLCLDLFSATSENHPKLKQALEKYPAADANKDGVLTMAEAKAYKAKMSKKAAQKKGADSGLQPHHIDVAYGQEDRQKLDLWIAKSDTPTPLLICIHGGGFIGGDKSKYHRDGLVPLMLEQGISVATINYRLTDGGKHPFPIPMHDGARAIQFLRHHAEQYNLDKGRFAATGGSAGGCMSLWLAFHDDLANPDSSDPVLRESSRLLAIAPNAAQPTLLLNEFSEIFDCDNLQEHRGFRPLFGLPLEGELTLTSEQNSLMQMASPMTHLSTDDVPVFLTYGGKDVHVDQSSSPGVYVHHPKQGMFLKEKMDQLGMECYLKYSGGAETSKYQDARSFLVAKSL